MSNKTIPNPNLRPPLTDAEREVLNSSIPNAYESSISTEIKTPNRRKTSGHMITVPNHIWEELEQYVEDHPEEGSKSGIITRLIASYIKNQKNGG